jgi:Kef-type K+ transport system membrane component KefB
LPAGAAGYLGLLAKVGVVLFMFLVGLELHPGELRHASRATLAISHASILVPFLLGSLLALGLYPIYGTAEIGFTTFSLFLGISLSVTAFPVLARILRDWRVQNTPLGAMALACAAVNDATAWTLLALVVGVANGQLATAALTLPAVLGYLAVMFLLARPFLKRLSRREDAREGPPEQSTLAMVFVAMLLSAWMTESIGIHALFGSFLLGALLPHDGRLATELRLRLEDVVVVLFLPAFFAFTGMRTQLGLLSSWTDWGWCLLIIVVATIGKVGGSAITARLNGMDNRASAAIGILMNTRGLMELIVLNVGLDLGVISPTLFAMLVLMAIATTFATSPLLRWFVGAEVFDQRRAA